MNKTSVQYKILVIDDKPDNVYYLQSRLQKENFLVVVAFSGKEGIEKASVEKPDCILLDIMMPEISGLEVAQHLQKNDETSNIPIILVTARVEAKDVEEGLKAGAIDYIKKPFDKVELIARLNSAIRFSVLKKKLINHEKLEMYEATMVTANHEIKQPLTLMTLTLNAIKRELNTSNPNKEVLLSKLSYIDEGIKRITHILNHLSSLKTPSTALYNDNIKMINLHQEEN